MGADARGEGGCSSMEREASPFAMADNRLSSRKYLRDGAEEYLLLEAAGGGASVDVIGATIPSATYSISTQTERIKRRILKSWTDLSRAFDVKDCFLPESRWAANRHELTRWTQTETHMSHKEKRSIDRPVIIMAREQAATVYTSMSTR